MSKSLVILVFAFAFTHATARNVPADAGLSEQKTFLPCIPRQSRNNNMVPNEQVLVHANAPTAESPSSVGLKDQKNFIYGGVGGFAGMGGYAGVIGGLPVIGGLGGIGKYGGIGGVGGVGGMSGLGGGGGAAAAGGLGGIGGAGGGASGLGGGMLPYCP